MKNRVRQRTFNAKTLRSTARGPIGMAVFFALHGIPDPAYAQQPPQQTESTSAILQEVVVTANRRQQSLETVPSSISVLSAAQLSATGITDIASLIGQVPGMSMFDFGARDSGSVFPIIRGLNASDSAIANRDFRSFEQAPVGTYIGNSPINGYFQLDDVERVEVLRGPQGTLYGAGSLGGALRIIPNSPELGNFAGNVEASVGSPAHSSGTSYFGSAMLNIPIGDTLAFRASGKYAYEPGFINVYGNLVTSGSPISIPVLANPADPVNSPGIFTGKDDWNYQKTFTGRASLYWKPVDKFNAELAVTYARLTGDGGPVVNPLFPGGSYPIDPRITFPRGGDYQDFSATDQPYSRTTVLTSLDLSYDVGFATLSSTSSYFTTTGAALFEATYDLAAANAFFPGYTQYYAGNPVNPRFVEPEGFTDSAHTFSQELRLVSTTGPDKLFDYVLGVFYENQETGGTWTVSEPGTPERAAAQGCTGSYYIGASFPNCLVGVGPGDVNFFQGDTQNFKNTSEFGELTWHFIRHGQITVGARHFQESFTDSQSYLLYAFATLIPPHERSAPASKNVWKIDASYEYAPSQFAYALWSQGFRRGGANAFPPAGEFKENPELLTYGPDTVDNYETGLKGHFSNGVRYTVDVFDDEWHNPQVSGSFPDGNIGVWNAKKARSRGAEFDLTTPLFLPGLSITAGGAYVDATFTENYSYTADVFGNISGFAGQQLPGSTKASAAATINYAHDIAPGYALAVALNETYRSAMPLTTFATIGTPATEVSGMSIANASVAVRHASWRMGVYVTNLANKRVILSPGESIPFINNLNYYEIVNRPREIDLRLSSSF
jgi:outer membrane receptor protein involved in Fe transport